MTPALAHGFIGRASFLAAALASVGCGSAARRAGGEPRPSITVAGEWEGVERETVATGDGPPDTKVERQSWHLEQAGSLVTGHYLVEQSLLSGDGRPYPCSGTPRATLFLRVELRGRVLGGEVELQEVGDLLAQGPCRPVFHGPALWTGGRKGGALALAAAGRKVQLYKRNAPDVEPRGELLTRTPAEATWRSALTFPALRGPTGGPPATVAGTWSWEGHAEMPGGDERREREEWHLAQRGEIVVGHYDRAVRQISKDGNRYRCNGENEIRIVTRYDVTGLVRGRRVALYERAYRVVEGGLCDNGERRLDVYEGTVTDHELRLEWGTGRQTLRRR